MKLQDWQFNTAKKKFIHDMWDLVCSLLDGIRALLGRARFRSDNNALVKLEGGYSTFVNIRAFSEVSTFQFD